MTERQEQLRVGLSLAYRLMADLFAGPVEEALLVRARQSPLMGSAMDEQTSIDEIAAQHQRAFEWAAFPQRGVFMDPGGWAEGTSARAVTEALASVGLTPRDTVATDHLSNILDALAAAMDFGDESAEARILCGQALPWIPAFTSAVERLGLSFPTALARQVEDLLLYHLSSRAGHAPGDFLLGAPPPPLALEDAETRLGDIVDHLLSPARCGLFMSRVDIQSVARSSGGSTGFGGRRTMLLHAIRTSVKHGKLSDLVQCVESIHLAWLSELERRVSEGFPEPIAAHWGGRCAVTLEALSALERAAREEAAR